MSFPLASDSSSLKVMITGAGDRDQGDVYVWQQYEDMTGVNVNWTTVTKSTRSEAVHAALTNHQQYDLIMRCKVSATKLLRYGNSGLILDLAKDGMLQEYAPNCWAYLQEHPDAMASVMNPDGTIYALPQVNSGAELRVGVKLFVNKQWLERVGMDLPTTTDELRELLAAFRDQDANGNGDPSDEIPFSSADWANAQLALYGAFGLGKRGFHNTAVDCDPATGTTRLIEGCDQYESFPEYMRGLYADGLLDKYLFTTSSDQWLANISSDRVGVFPMTNLAQLPADKADNWVALDEALAGPDGDKLWSAVRANFHSTGAAVIPATCSNPELVLRWLDYFWTDEGTLFYHMGVEGETYEALEDGTYDYLSKIYDEMAAKNLSFDEVVCEYSPYPGGSNPTVEIAPYFMGGEMAEVTAQAESAGGQAGTYVFAFSDTGVGIPPEFIDQVFDTFTRASGRMVTETEGTGLGMAIAKKLVELMGGTIRCESEVGQGTTFTVVMHMRYADESEALSLAVAAGRHGAGASDGEDVVANLAGKRILLVEDNAMNREIAKRTIAETGAQIEEADDGKEAVDAFSGHPAGHFDLVFMDIQMPVMNGYDATAAIRSMDRPDARTVPIYAMTANTFDEDVRQVRDAGMNGHIGKPYSPQKLYGVLAQVFGQG